MFTEYEVYILVCMSVSPHMYAFARCVETAGGWRTGQMAHGLVSSGAPLPAKDRAKTDTAFSFNPAQHSKITDLLLLMCSAL